MSWTKGTHNLKFGFDGWKQISPQSFTQRSRGDYEWSYLSDYLFDYNPDYLAERSLGGVEYYGDRIFTGLFVNDSWKTTPHLTVNVGLRYEYQTVPHSEQQQTVNAISSVPGLIVFGKPTAMTNAWMPRVGMAYSPGNSGKTSIRAGFGRSFDVLVDNFGLLTLPPQVTTTVDVPGLNAARIPGWRRHPAEASAAALTQAQARAGTSGYAPNQVRPNRCNGTSAYSTCSMTTTPLRAATWARAASTCRCRRSWTACRRSMPRTLCRFTPRPQARPR